ncbi:MAG TPA: SLC13 family permease [Bacteroidota bacterium]
MEPDAVFTLAVLVLLTAALALEAARTEILVFGALLLFLLTGILSPGEAFDGFSNQGLLAVAFLYVVAAALEATGVINGLATLVLGKRRGPLPMKLTRFLFPVAGASAFLNNTPIVAMMIPVVKRWCRKHNLSASKFLLPLSHAAILGGMCTLIGTSTNLVVHGLLLDHGHPGFSFFELGRVGIPLSIVGIGLIVLVLHRWLPDRKDAIVQLGETTREFVIEVKVNRHYKGIGKTVEGAGLRHLQGLFLFQIERGGKVLAPIEPSEKILVHDRLFFTGIPATIVELQKQKGLDVIREFDYDLKNYDSDTLKTYEVVVSESSPLAGKTVRDSGFRGRYNAAILAIHRSGARIQKKIGDVSLEPGDTLLIIGPKDFHERWYHSKDFYLVSTSDTVASKPRLQIILSLLITVTMIGVVTFELLPMAAAAGTAAVLLIVSRCINASDAFSSVDWPTLLVIASAFGIAEAVEQTGLAGIIAGKVAALASPYGIFGLIAATYFATVAYTELITNNAAAALMFPLGLSIASQANLDVMPFAYAVVLGASTGFAMPIGYQTNLMVYGPGGYRFTDYLKVGIPLDIVIGLTGSGMIYWLFFG